MTERPTYTWTIDDGRTFEPGRGCWYIVGTDGFLSRLVNTARNVEAYVAEHGRTEVAAEYNKSFRVTVEESS